MEQVKEVDSDDVNKLSAKNWIRPISAISISWGWGSGSDRF